MSRYLLDSDAIIDYLKGIAATIALIRQLSQQGHQLCSCDVVECEVYAGLPPDQHRRAAELLDALEYLPLSRQAARRAGEWRRVYRAQGIQLATSDCLIAATAHEHSAGLVTRNLKDFPMPELTIVAVPQPPR